MALSKKKKMILWGLGIGVAGAGGYFGWQFLQSRRNKAQELPPPEFIPAELPASSSSSGSYARNDNFPLKKGSKGSRVKTLQQTLITKYGANILPRYGADGDWGTETDTALRSKGLPTVIDENTYNGFVKSASSDPKQLAQQLYEGASNRVYSKVESALRKMHTTSDYSAVSKLFQQYRMGGVRQTLVNGLLSRFSGNQKDQIKMEFLRMGLKFNGSTWSLSGIPKQVMTIRPAKVVDRWNRKFNVPARTVLGYEIACKNGLCLFRTMDNQLLVTHSKAIQFI